MANFAKIWTDIFNDEWFVSLSLAERGMWLQMIVYAKLSGDSSTINLRNFPQLASIFGCDRKTAVKMVGKFAENSPLDIEIKDTCITINLRNYDKYQRDRKPSDRKSHGKVKEISLTNKIRQDQIKENNTISFSKEKESPQAAPEVTKSDWNMIRKACANVFSVEQGGRVIGWFQKNRPGLLERPVLFSWYLLRMYYKQRASGKIENPWAYLQAMHSNGWITPSLEEGGDGNCFQEHQTVAYYCAPILGQQRPVENTKRGGDFETISEGKP